MERERGREREGEREREVGTEHFLSSLCPFVFFSSQTLGGAAPQDSGVAVAAKEAAANAAVVLAVMERAEHWR